MGKRWLSWASMLLSLHVSVAANSAGDNGSNKRMAVNLAYHDALNSQLDHAVPELQKYDFKVSFYPMLASPTFAKRLPEWRALAERGHEFGSHGIYHPCSKSQPDRDWVLPHRDLDTYSLGRIRDELITANLILHMLDGKHERSFDPPCEDRLVNGKNYSPEVEDLFVAIQGNEKKDKHLYKVFSADGHSGEQLVAEVKKARASGKEVLTIVIHGIGADYIRISPEAHAHLLRYLANNQADYWLDTYLNIMKTRLGRQ